MKSKRKLEEERMSGARRKRLKSGTRGKER